MAFSEIELKNIDNKVGALCRWRSPARIKDKLYFEYEVIRHDVIIWERRPRYNDPSIWTKSAVAKLKYDRTNRRWKLYWMRSDMKWHLYDPSSSTGDLDLLVDEVDRDPHGAFFG
jgi:hypothetical protein